MSVSKTIALHEVTLPVSCSRNPTQPLESSVQGRVSSEEEKEREKKCRTSGEGAEEKVTQPRVRGQRGGSRR